MTMGSGYTYVFKTSTIIIKISSKLSENYTTYIGLYRVDPNPILHVTGNKRLKIETYNNVYMKI